MGKDHDSDLLDNPNTGVPCLQRLFGTVHSLWVSSSSLSELSSEVVLKRGAAGVTSTPDDVPIANRGSCTGDFLATDNGEIIVVLFKSRVSALFSTEMTARAANAAAAGLIAEVAMADRGFELVGKVLGRGRDLWGYPSLDFVTLRLLVIT